MPVIKNKKIWPDFWSDKTCVMGVLNVTPDSFSDGGKYFSHNSAIERASQMINEGADVIDIGAQSTRPGAEIIGSDEELDRLIPVLKSIRYNHPEIIISIDTFQSKVASKALDIGANWINDVSGGRYDPFMLDVVSSSQCPYILMHSRGNSKTMSSLTSYKNITLDVISQLLLSTEKAISKGIDNSKIIWDPGIGFAKDTVQNIQLLKDLETIAKEGFPLLIGPSRKRFIGDLINEPDSKKRLTGTIAVVCRCVQANINLIRVHDVKEVCNAIIIANNIFN